MFRFLKSLFGRSIQLPVTYENRDNNENDIRKYFLQEIEKSHFLKKESHDQVLKHLLGEINILKTENKLTVAEKKALEINTRLSITKELVNVLNEEGLKIEYPKSIITDMSNRASNSKLSYDSYIRAKKAGVTKFKLISSGGGMGDCDWCIQKQKLDFLSDADISFFLENKCNCEPYSYSYLEPEINFED
jgi:hypothetical protein